MQPILKTSMDLDSHEITTWGELKQAIKEGRYVVTLKRGGKKDKIHKSCGSFSIHITKPDNSKLGQTKTHQRYFAYETLEGAYEKYKGKHPPERFPCVDIPYCRMCLANQRKEWLQRYNCPDKNERGNKTSGT